MIQTLNGAVDGSNKVFTLPAPYQFQLGTTRIIWNGVIYPPSDPDKGYAENSTTQITTTLAPVGGPTPDVLQLSFEPLVANGSPFHPTNLYP